VSLHQAARLLAEISDKIGYKEKHKLYSTHAAELFQQLESYWSEEYGVYCDYATQSPSEADLKEVRERGVGRVKLRLGLECHPGYVGIFPLLLQLLPADSHNLGRMLDVLGDPEQLWSPFGIRSLSAKDSYFGAGENYWRGAIWINCNFLALKVRWLYLRHVVSVWCNPLVVFRPGPAAL
jgi:mannosyl-oligosaccharide glucosidase